MIRAPRAARAVSMLLLALFAVGEARAGRERHTAPIEDQIDVVQLDRRVLAVVGTTGRTLEAKLERGEQVLHTESRGAVGLVATNVRLLGATSRSASWRELRYRVREREDAPTRFVLSERVVLVPLSTRVAALSDGASNWSELALGPQERLVELRAESRVGLVLTERRAVGFPSTDRGFAEIALSPQESAEGISLEPGSVRITTDRRLLLFRPGTRFWSQLLRTDRR